jgi:large subunit ribosomal protein L18
MTINRRKKTLEKHQRIRQNLKGTADRPRLSVYRSGKNIYAQIIDDNIGKTLVSSSTIEVDIKQKIKFGGNCEASELVGTAIAKKSIEKGISQVVFDRGGYLYHGRIKALAEAARNTGLNF